MNLLLDSVIVIDHLNGIEAATRYLAEQRGAAAISVITRAEVLAGSGRDEVALAGRFLDCFPTLGIDKPIADFAAELRRRQGWKLPDAFQAAIAQHHGLKLVTRNVEDFPPRKFDFVTVPYAA